MVHPPGHRPSNSGTPGRTRLFRVRYRYQTYMSGVGTLTIGRRSGADIVLRDPLVSRDHARIIVGAETAAIEDLGSANGVSVNGRKMTGLQRLKQGDEIRIGEQVLEVLGFGDSMPEESDATEMRRMDLRSTWTDDEPSPPARVTHVPKKDR